MRTRPHSNEHITDALNATIKVRVNLTESCDATDAKVSRMRIGVLGAGSIGGTVTRRLSESGHTVKVANSRGPETIDPGLLLFGATAVDASDVALDVDIFITSIPFSRIPTIASLVHDLPGDSVVIDTSNYYPSRDGGIAAVDDGQVESAWVEQVLGRPVVKAWNAITSQSFAGKAMSAGAPGRIAIPVAADHEGDRRLAMSLVDETGFDPFDAGPIAESWRQQPASPAYCTDLSLDQMPAALAAADQQRSPRRRDLAMAVIVERTKGFSDMGEDFGEWLVQLNRAIYL